MDSEDRVDPTQDHAGPPADPAGTVAADLRTAAAELPGLAERPLEEHVGVYERLHARMQSAMRGVDE